MPDATNYAYNYPGKIDSSKFTPNWTWAQQEIYKPTVAKYLARELYIVIV